VTDLRHLPKTSFSLACADATTWLASLPAGDANLVVTDPAYESLEKHRAVGTTTRLTKRWFPIFKNERYDDLFALLHRALAKDSHCYVFSDHETMPFMVASGAKAGFKFWKPLVWDKCKIGMGYHYRAQYEFILFFEKGKRKLNDLGIGDVIREPRIRTVFPTEKPTRVSSVLINQSTLPGEHVIDPFLGSGSSGVAALVNRRSYAGCDIDTKTVTEARARLVMWGMLAHRHDDSTRRLWDPKGQDDQSRDLTV
jgi:site-specific DNA-methyltransferase (adenine-specific)